jgi:hypothetical protein
MKYAIILKSINYNNSSKRNRGVSFAGSEI